MRSAVIFDCDGVLFDSWKANIAYYDAIRAALGLAPMDAEWQRQAHFLAASQLLDAMFVADPALLTAAREAARAIDYGPFYELMAPAPGLFELLSELKTAHRLGMATNRSTTVAGVMTRFGLGRWLDAAIGLLDVAHPKPAPDVIVACLERLDVSPAAALYVGDAESDLHAARAAGVHFVAVGSPAWSPVAVPVLSSLPAYVRTLTLGTSPVDPR
ncbi:MAG TPA: HAD-IA family hydrolase [Candidatus Binatia bacterium]|jgi:HAD superfamily hydrolase (TIGR01509 family)|nr:HAD-IA family hydrolase [Candidatus Binatia bacterium]